MKITKLSLCVSMVGLLATLPAAYANEMVTNCTQVSAVDGGDTDTTNNESCAKLTIPFDFGDAPDPSFQTLDASGGARHQLGTDVYLGKCVDGDTGLLQGGASADDADKGSPEYGTCTDTFDGDEDGVAIAPLHVGDTKNVVQVTATTGCKLNAWVDWNQDGSWGGAGEQVFIDQVLSAGQNDLTMDVPAFAAEGTIYTRFRCSTAGGDGIGGEAADGEVEDYALNILPAIPKVPVSVGDLIWEDSNQNGKLDAGEQPLAGATVTLLDKDGNPAKDLDGKLVAAMTTDATGKYLFSNLPEGDYAVSVAPPKDYIPTLNAGDVDTAPANDDSNCSANGDGSITTALFTLTAGAEPVDDGDTDANSNLGVDCGFYQPKEPTHSLGNKVWVDDGAGTEANANNGKLDAGEDVVADEVVLELKDSTGKVISSTTTSNGYYLFSGLAAGDYEVCVAASNFAAGGVLAGYSTSTGGNETDANLNKDNNDNGTDDTSTGLCSGSITLGADEPVGETDTSSGNAGDDGVGTEDARSNLTVDFAVIPPKPATPVSVGDTIWIDANADGIQDAGEALLAGATVTLLGADGQPVNDLDGKPVAPANTDATGKYLFSNLKEGDYTISVKAPDGYAVTKGGADVDDNPSNTDSNCAVQGDGSVASALFTLTAGAEPIDDGDTDTDADSNLSVDCGFYQPATPLHSIGNMVWVDDGAGDKTKADNGLYDAGETLPSNVKVELRSPDGTVVSSMMTDQGYYLFSGLEAGEYKVCVAANNFSGAGKLVGYTAGVNGKEADANSNQDNNDNGDTTVEDGLCATVVVLDDKEPTGESPTATGTAGDDGAGTEDGRSNLTVDFAVIPPVTPAKPVSVGDIIWIDTNKNGLQDEGEGGLEGVVVTLLTQDGQPVKDIDGKDVTDITTGADGKYLFSNLSEGRYDITIKAPDGYVPTIGGALVDLNKSNNDSNCALMGNATQPIVEIAPFNLTAGMEPDSLSDGDGVDSNLTVDCGLYQPTPDASTISGNVKVDTNGDTVGEDGIEGVTLALQHPDGTPVLDKEGKPVTILTDAVGKYIFIDVTPGDYLVVEIDPAGYTSVIDKDNIWPEDDAVNTDTNDNSIPVSVVADEDDEGNDFVDRKQSIPTHSLGNRVWIDTNNNGLADAGELAAMAGVTLELKDEQGTVITSTSTDVKGRYLFSALAAGSYRVCVVANNFSAGAVLEGYTASTGGNVADANTDIDGDDNGDDDTSKGLCSGVVVLDDKEPTNEATATGNDGNDGMGTDDLRSNLTVDFGIVPPVEPAKPVAVGDMIWIDANENGTQDAGESPLVGAVVTLLGADGKAAKDLDGNDIAPFTTLADGKYLFSNLPEGDYTITVTAPEGYVVTKGGADVDENPSNTDSNCSVVGSSVQSALFTLTAGAEPTDDGDSDASSNLGVDCGFYQPKEPTHSLGNKVWVDDGAGTEANANNGNLDAGESVVADGVTLELKDSTGTVISSTTTSNGYYLFSGLAAGDYEVCVAASNFADGGKLAGYSASTGGNETDANLNLDNNDNGSDDTGKGLCSGSITLGADEPVGETGTASGTAGDDGMGTDDARSNLTIDFAVIPPVTPAKPVSVGDYIWIDANENGIQDEGESPLAGAVVTLLGADGKAAKDMDGNDIAPFTTLADGKYLFSNLSEGDYTITVTAPEGYVVTKGGADVDENPSNTDSNCSVVGSSVQSALFTLTAGAEPTDDGDSDASSNLGVDCGFYQPKQATFSLGNKVWVDDGAGTEANANNGKRDAGELAIPDGVTVELWGKDGKPVDLGSGALSVPTTNGFYLFGNLPAGEYKACIAAGNFATGGKLEGYTASTGGDELDPNLNVDDNDNGDNDLAYGICSDVVTLGPDADEPTGEPDTASGKPGDDGIGTEDARSNLTVDFGLLPPKPAVKTVSVGNYIWVDANENGQQDAGELPMEGAEVSLLTKDGAVVVLDGDMAVPPQTTGKDGKYLFSGLPEGEYRIKVSAPAGYIPTKSVASVDEDASNTDSNCAANNDNVTEVATFKLLAGTEPTTEADGDDANGNLTVDCGFYQPKAPTHSIGNMVWVDDGAGNETKANNGQFDAGEALPSGVTVELRDDKGTFIRSVETAGGYYLFDGLESGEYTVCVAGSNFNDSKVLAGYTASTVADEADVNAGQDNHDNGDNTVSDGLCSEVIVLDDKEPKGESPTASGTAGDDGAGTEDTRSNLTVDFAVVPKEPVEPNTPVSVGNQIWIDSDGDGEREEGEKMLAGATVTLTDASGRAVTDLDGKPVEPHITGEDGLYVFSNLPEGEYIVTVQPPEGFFLTVGGIDADDDASDIDSNCRVNPLNETIETHPFNLDAGDEPDVDGDDTNGNMTIDCGFYGTVALGNKIWFDSNANGQQDNAEEGLSGVSVSLFEEDGETPATDINGQEVAEQETDASGNYLFENLKPGNYIVVVNPGTESGFSLTKGGADPDTDASDTDSNCKVVAGSFQTPAVTLSIGGEPGAKVDGDDESINSTVDCGLFRPVNLGSRLWLDLDGNGKQDGGEPGVPGATITLLTVDGKPVTDIFGDVVKPQTTGSDGDYFFGNLREGQYVLKVVPPAGYLPTVATSDPNNNDGSDSNGILNADGSISSKPIDLKWGEEPSDGGATNTTVGFGLIANLHVPTLSQWGMMIMSMLLGAVGLFRRRRED